MKWWMHIFGSYRRNEVVKRQEVLQLRGNSRKEKITKGAEDFAVRFENVMRDLAKS